MFTFWSMEALFHCLAISNLIERVVVSNNDAIHWTIEFKVMALIRDYCYFLKILERINLGTIIGGKWCKYPTLLLKVISVYDWPSVIVYYSWSGIKNLLLKCFPFLYVDLSIPKRDWVINRAGGRSFVWYERKGKTTVMTFFLIFPTPISL